MAIVEALFGPAYKQRNMSKEEALMHFNKCKYNQSSYKDKTNG